MSDYLMHYGVGHLNGGHSGRYPWGSGKDPKSSEKKHGLFSKLGQKLAGKKENDADSQRVKADTLKKAVNNEDWKHEKSKKIKEIREIASDPDVKKARDEMLKQDSKYQEYLLTPGLYDYYARMAANVNFRLLNDLDPPTETIKIEDVEEGYLYEDADQGDWNSFDCYLVDNGIDPNGYEKRLYKARNKYYNEIEKASRKVYGDYLDEKPHEKSLDTYTLKRVVEDVVKSIHDDEAEDAGYENPFGGYYDAGISSSGMKQYNTALKEMEKFKKTHPFSKEKSGVKHSDVSSNELTHSFKGSVWKNHKYIKKEDGRYFYPKESAAAGAYDNEIGVKEGQLKILYDTKAAHTKRMNESLEAGDEKAAAKYKEYIENIDKEVAALTKELAELHEHANLDIKSPYNARRLKKLSHSEDAEDLLNDFLQHYGVGPDENPPGRGSGRYAKGSGKDPYQHDPAMRKKLGLFGGLRRTKEEREAEKKRKRRLASLEKARKTAKANREKAEKERVAKEKYETEKNAALASGDPEKIAKYATNLTNQEQQDAIRRIENIQNLNRKASEAAAAREAANRKPDKFDRVMTKVESLAKKGVRLRNVAEDGIKIWNTFVSINNAFNPDEKLPKIGSSDDKKDNDQQNNDKKPNNSQQNNGKKPNNDQQNNDKKPNQETNNRDFKNYDNSNPDDVITGPVTVESTNPKDNTTKETESKRSREDDVIDAVFREVKNEDVNTAAEAGVKYYRETTKKDRRLTKSKQRLLEDKRRRR